MDNKQHLRLIIGGFLSLAVVMGIGRFAYTPLLPYMEEATGLSSFSSGLLATWNYIGYFLGALLAGRATFRVRWFYIFLFVSAMTTYSMGVTESMLIWSALRLLSGVASGFVFVFMSEWIIRRLAEDGGAKGVGLLYSGVGFGILFTGIVLPLILPLTTWQMGWVFLGVVSIGLIVGIYQSTKHVTPTSLPTRTISVGKKQPLLSINVLLISYFLEGFGYIIYATFITSVLATVASFSFDVVWIWAIVGMGAMPSCFFWAWLGRVLKKETALILAYLIQVVSLILPTGSTNALLVFLSAFGFGATFMGITVLTIALAKEQQTMKPVVSQLTAAYAIGQLLGPVVAGMLLMIHGETVAFVVSAGAVALALVFLCLSYMKRGQQHAVRQY
ncbi:YbfB/YjiJ family MFS transporter [Alkalihalobacillus sp. LMS6]|uniref:YbfB/YjiJ family MFS transporter n=1 Tax=Alkalihalobacillus sp. LMS6 TaxID=2924034 RepID=UPI0020D1138D|nr:YbfB/YjiJ family MFS transporter [Alkalihalobacillus sp. LMS6]UTR06005.1 YbfB/YjiJ family MFS transporter [Alkalihalobacillus sp. LMS6]